MRPYRDRAKGILRYRTKAVRIHLDRVKEPCQIVFHWSDSGVAAICTGCFSGRVYRSNFWDDWSLPVHGVDEVEEWLMGWYKQPSVDGSSEKKGCAANDPELQQECPALVEYLTLTVSPDGKERRPSTLLLFAEDNAWKACLNERDEGLTLWAAGDSIWDALRVLDTLLRQERPPWRKSKGQQQSKGKGK